MGVIYRGNVFGSGDNYTLNDRTLAILDTWHTTAIMSYGACVDDANLYVARQSSALVDKYDKATKVLISSFATTAIPRGVASDGVSQYTIEGGNLKKYTNGIEVGTVGLGVTGLFIRVYNGNVYIITNNVVSTYLRYDTATLTQQSVRPKIDTETYVNYGTSIAPDRVGNMYSIASRVVGANTEILLDQWNMAFDTNIQRTVIAVVPTLAGVSPDGLTVSADTIAIGYHENNIPAFPFYRFNLTLLDKNTLAALTTQSSNLNANIEFPYLIDSEFTPGGGVTSFASSSTGKGGRRRRKTFQVYDIT